MNYSYDENNIHINNSYLMHDKDDMDDYLTAIRIDAIINSNIEYKRSNASWIREWCAHNWLYEHGIQTARTKDVDLNENETWWKKLGYLIIYILFCR